MIVLKMADAKLARWLALSRLDRAWQHATLGQVFIVSTPSSRFYWPVDPDAKRRK